MIDIKSFQCNPLMVNNYIISDDTKEACLIDCGCFNEGEWNHIKSYIDKKGLKLTHLLCTHLHFDHIMGCGFVYRDFGLNIEGSIIDQDQYNNLYSYIEAFGLNHSQILPPPPIADISSKEAINYGHHQLQIIQTPGHSPGGLCFYDSEEQILFAGDTLFCGSIGRTDLPKGNFQDIILSITQKLLTLPSTTHVLTGHGPATTIEYEQKYNEYLK